MAVYSGRKAVAAAGTRVQLTTTHTACAEVTIMPDPGNTGNIYVGGNTVSSANGLTLIKTAAPVKFSGGAANPLNLEDFWIDAATNADAALYVYIVR